MQGDFTRNTHKKRNHYSRVLMQQGRVQLDADWNEQLDIHDHINRTVRRDVIGYYGGPQGNDPDGNPLEGFEIRPKDANLLITAGRYYVNGVLAENEAEHLFTDQVDFRGAKLPTSPGMYLIYLDVWERHITALDDPDIREKALNGPDTATRARVMAQVKWEPVAPGSSCSDFGPGWTPPGAVSTGTLAARAEPDPAGTQPCVMPEEAGYRRLENQLYRVEIHGEGGLDSATFKWSRENGSVVARWLSQDGDNLIVSSSGKDEVLGFADKGWIELTDEIREQASTPGTLVMIDNVLGNVITIDSSTALGTTNLADFDTATAKIRRWESNGAEIVTVPATNDGWIPLEDGVEIKFQAGKCRTGDYWLIPARTLLGDVLWDTKAGSGPEGFHLRHGIHHCYCPLALGRFTGTGWSDLTECRLLFPPLTDITADDVSFDDTVCRMGAETVQEAVNRLCQRDKGTCTLVAIPGQGWERIFDRIGENQDAQICFRVGTYQVRDTVSVANKGNITIAGCGRGTRIIAPNAEAVFSFQNCQSVVVRDIYAESGATGSKGKTRDLNGTLSFCGCTSVTVEQVSLKCAAGAKRAATCLTVLDTCDSDPDENRIVRPSSVRIRHCDLRIGHQQAGILLVNVLRAHVEDNVLRAYDRPWRLSFAKLLQDQRTRATARRLLVSGAHLGAQPPVEREINATVAFGDHVVHFKTEKSMAEEWQKVLDENPPARVESDRDLLIHVKKLAARIILNGGILGDSRIFKPWYEAIRRQNPAVASQGIVIGGQIARDIRILSNTIDGVLQGIRVGVSHREKTPGKADLAGTVIVSNNTIGVLLPAIGVRERYGIFIGNCDSLLLEDNYLKVQRFSKTRKLHVEGVRIYGYLGKRMIVRQNHLVDFAAGKPEESYGIYVHPLNEFRRPQWLVADNVASVRVRPSANVRQSHNYA